VDFLWIRSVYGSRGVSAQTLQWNSWHLLLWHYCPRDVWRGTCIKVSVPKRDCHSSSKGRPAPTFYRQFVSQGHEAVSLFLYYFLKLSNCTLFCSKGGSFWKHQISCPFFAIIVCLRDELKALALLSCKFYVQHKVLTCLKSFLENTWKEPLCQGKPHTYHKLSLKYQPLLSSFSESLSPVALPWTPLSLFKLGEEGRGCTLGQQAEFNDHSLFPFCLFFGFFLHSIATMHHAPDL
jgi:hypothetical protein